VIIQSTDSRLNTFRHFGGDQGNENNLTRALLLTLVKSSGGRQLLGRVLQAVADAVLHTDPERAEVIRGLQSSECVKCWMQQAPASMESLPKLSDAFLIELAPQEGEAAAEVQAAALETGIFDAVLLFRSGSCQVLLVIESKLYGPVGMAQRNKYMRWLRKLIGREVHPPVCLRWEKVYQLAFSTEAESKDFVLSDFVQFLREKAHLVGFPGFEKGDFSLENAASLNLFLWRLCERIAREPVGPYKLSFRHEKGRSDADYDLHVDCDDALGNLGVAFWGETGTTLCSKLVIGCDHYWKTSKLLEADLNSPHILRALQDLSETCNFGVFVVLEIPRDTPRKFDRVELRDAELDGMNLVKAWSQIVRMTEALHHQEITEAWLEVVGCHFAEREKALRTLRRLKERGRRPRCHVVFYIAHEEAELVARAADEQVELVKTDLTRLAGLMEVLSGGRECASVPISVVSKR